MPALRELLARFDIDVRDEALRRGDQRLERFKSGLRTVGTMLVSGVAAVGVTRMVQGQQELARELDNTARALDVNVERLQEMNVVFRRAGVGSDQTRDALKTLNERMDEMRLGSGEAKEALGGLGLGLEASELQGLSTQQQLLKVSDALAGMEDNTRKVRIAEQLFAETGTRILPILDKGSDHLRELMQEARTAGGIMSEETVQALKESTKETDRLSLAFRGIKARMTLALLPALKATAQFAQDVIGAFEDWDEASGKAKAAIIAVTSALAAFALVKLVAFWEVTVVFLAIAAAVAAAVLVIDEINTAFAHGESFINDWVQAATGIDSIGTIARIVGIRIAELKAAFRVAGRAVDAFGDLFIAAVRTWQGAIQALFLSIQEGFAAMKTGNIAQAGIRAAGAFSSAFGDVLGEQKKAADDAFARLERNARTSAGLFQGTVTRGAVQRAQERTRERERIDQQVQGLGFAGRRFMRGMMQDQGALKSDQTVGEALVPRGQLARQAGEQMALREERARLGPNMRRPANVPSDVTINVEGARGNEEVRRMAEEGARRVLEGANRDAATDLIQLYADAGEE